jgi:uncharacterized protein
MMSRYVVVARAGMLACLLLLPVVTRADDIPQKPARYFNDQAHVVDATAAEELNNQLEDFERETSNQIIVAVYPKMETTDGLDDYCYRIFQAWGVGRKRNNNGAVLFVFVQNHKMRIQTGYGLEGALPDVTCDSILNDLMAPYFKRGDYAGGLRAGVNAMIAATKGEYKGTGHTVADNSAGQDTNSANVFVFIAFGLLMIFSIFRRTRGMIYGADGIGRYAGWYLAGGGGFGGGGSSGGGGFGGGGGFSGGGGSSGGGGASGGW